MDREEREAYENEQVVSRWELLDESDDEGADDGKVSGEDARRTALERKEKAEKTFEKLFGDANQKEKHHDIYTGEPKIGRMDAAMVSSKFIYGKSLNKLDKKEKQEINDILNSVLCDNAGRYLYSVLKGCIFEDKERLEGKFSEKKLIKMTSSQEYELKTAFSVVVGCVEGVVSDEKLSVDQLDDVFMAVGLTLQDSDLEYIIEKVDLDAEGMIAYEDLREAYEDWRIMQMEIPTVQALFNMLVEDKGITKTQQFPYHYKGKRSGDATIPHRALRNAVNKVMHLHGKLALRNDEEIQCLVNEIASDKERKITFKDFCSMFSGLDI